MLAAETTVGNGHRRLAKAAAHEQMLASAVLPRYAAKQPNELKHFVSNTSVRRRVSMVIASDPPREDRLGPFCIGPIATREFDLYGD